MSVCVWSASRRASTWPWSRFGASSRKTETHEGSRPTIGDARADLVPELGEDRGQEALRLAKEAPVVERPAAAEALLRHDDLATGVLEDADGGLQDLGMERVVERVGPEDDATRRRGGGVPTGRPVRPTRTHGAPSWSRRAAATRPGTSRRRSAGSRARGRSRPRASPAAPAPARARRRWQGAAHASGKARPPVDEAHRIGRRADGAVPA